MRRPTITDVLTLASVLLALGAAVAFFTSTPTLAGGFLAIAVALVAATVRSVARDLGRQQAQLNQRLDKMEKSARAVGRQVAKGLAKADDAMRSHRRVIRTAVTQADRIEERTDAMSRRILADIGAARLDKTGDGGILGGQSSGGGSALNA